MAVYKYRRAYCSNCDGVQAFRQPRPDIPRNLLLSVVTLGLWIFRWVELVERCSKRRWRCSTCGFALHRPDSMK